MVVCVTEHDPVTLINHTPINHIFQLQLLPQPALAQIIHTNTSFEERLAFSCETLVLCGRVFQS